MDKIVIRGGKVLKGSVKVGGAKNAALPILLASLVTDKECKFDRVPVLQDIHTTLAILEQMGVQVSADLSNHKVSIHAREVKTTEAPYDLVRKMRASFIVLGPCLARMGRAKISLPGGCAIGARPVDIHLSAFEKLGAKIQLESGYVLAEAKQLIGNRVHFDFPSVGATENLMMAAVLAKGETLLENCAREPEIVDLANFLRGLGAVIEGDGSEKIRIQGKASLGGTTHSIMGDRIEAGTYLAAGIATRGEVEVQGLASEHLESVLQKFEEVGAKIERGNDSIRAVATHLKEVKSVDIKTAPFPGFPTDMQAQFMALMCVANGSSVISETIFENRFMHVPELSRLGADLTVRGNTVVVKGNSRLIGAPVMATDLRASASLVIAGLCAAGETTVNRVYHLDRGYESLEKKFRALGADIERQ